jgi:hypothetical protein
VTIPIVKKQYSRIFSRMVWVIENPRLSLDRAHRVILETGLEQLEHVPKRIWKGISVQV